MQGIEAPDGGGVKRRRERFE